MCLITSEYGSWALFFFVFFGGGGGGGLTFDLENFPTSWVKGRILLEATPP